MMHLRVSDLLTHIKVGCPICWYLVFNYCKRSLVEIWFSFKYWILFLALNGHVVQDDTTIHHLPHLRFRPGQSGVPYNDILRLEHPKCPLDILLASLLALGKVGVLPSWHRV